MLLPFSGFWAGNVSKSCAWPQPTLSIISLLGFLITKLFPPSTVKSPKLLDVRLSDMPEKEDPSRLIKK